MSTFAAEAIEITKTFYTPAPVEVLKGIHLSIKRGSSIAIMGDSGSGKSTLLNILGTLEKPTSGEIIISGKSAYPHRFFLRNQKIGFIFQSFHLLEDESVIDNVLMPAKIMRKKTDPNSPAYQKALSLLDRVGLSHRLHFKVSVLSGGEKQRVCIARALINDPELIFADEPSGNLDQHNAEEVHRLLLECTKEKKAALVVVTHNHDLAKLCDEIYILKQGKLSPCAS